MSFSLGLTPSKMWPFYGSDADAPSEPPCPGLPSWISDVSQHFMAFSITHCSSPRSVAGGLCVGSCCIFLCFRYSPIRGQRPAVDAHADPSLVSASTTMPGFCLPVTCSQDRKWGWSRDLFLFSQRSESRATPYVKTIAPYVLFYSCFVRTAHPSPVTLSWLEVAATWLQVLN